ncbi:hypothetical protein [Glycomyces salinus]|uniref:hypothetical protein n=1 Tax=Glycomyces salinus TaxID=980294 RepID=UPI0018EE00A0|nr:hypothetical protein [Glycomyces salinus]
MHSLISAALTALLVFAVVFGGAIVIDLIWNAVRFARARHVSDTDNEGNHQ